MVPETISHYRIVRKLGSGGMGEVYLAEDLELSRLVALKLLPRGEESEARLRRFSREAQAASALSHPHVAHLYEIGHEGDLHFLTMEYVEGKPLDEYIGGRPLPNKEILTFAIQIADALQEAHAKRIIHRDIKPSNIMITARGVKVLDFGLAKINAPDGGSGADQHTVMKTAPGIMMGTPSHMAPEQALGRDVDARSDLFSLGVVLYEMSTGRLPFAGSTTMELLQHILESEPEAMARFNYALSPELERIVRKCLEKEPERRYQTATDLLVDLRSLDRSSSGDIKKEHSIARSRFRPFMRPFPLLATIAVVATLVGWIVLRRGQVARPGTPGGKISSLAVLPLINLSGDPSQDYFADGITEGLIANLTRIGSLRVISRASAMQYKGARKPLSRIAKELKVDAIVEGNVMRSGDGVRITAQLIDTATNRQRWTQTYDRPLEDILDLQRDVTMSIAGQIPARLDPQLLEYSARASSVNPQAYDLYLKARYEKMQMRWSESVRLLEEAIRIDRDFSPAYAALAGSYVLGSNLRELSFPESLKARIAATKAVELDATLPEAYLVLSDVKLFLDWDFAGSEESLNRAIQLAPGNAEAYRRRAWMARIIGDRRMEIAEAIRARELDPVGIHASLLLAEAFVNSGKYPEAVAESRKTLELPERVFEHTLARQTMGHALMHQKRFREGLQLLKRNRDEAPGRLSRSIQLAHAYLLAGEPVRAREIFDSWFRKPEPAGSPVEMAMLFSLAEDRDAAFRLLDEAFTRHDVGLLLLIKEEPFEPLRSDPRYRALLARIGLPWS